MTTIHMHDPKQDRGFGDNARVSLCNVAFPDMANLTRHDLDVTCENCLAKMPKAAPTGVWFVYGTDTYDFPLFVSDEEIIALRWAVDNRVHQPRVSFWEFGVDWDEMNKREIEKRRARGELQ